MVLSNVAKDTDENKVGNNLHFYWEDWESKLDFCTISLTVFTQVNCDNVHKNVEK